MLSDLRESGAIEQDADIVCFIHRPEYYTRSGEDASGKDIRGLAELIIAKHRSGAVGIIDMRFVAKYAKFENFNESFADFTESTGKTQSFASRMNNDTAPAPTDEEISTLSSSFANTAGLTPGPAIMPGPGDEPVPF